MDKGSQKFRKYFFICFYIATICFLSSSYIFYYLGAKLQNLGFNETVIGFIQSIPRILTAIALLLFWNRVESVNKEKTLIFASIIGIVSFLLLTYSQNIYIIAFSCVLISFYTFSLRVFITPLLVENTLPEKRRSGILLFSSAHSLGGFFGPILADYLEINILASGTALLAGSIYSFIALLMMLAIAIMKYLFKIFKPYKVDSKININTETPNSKSTVKVTYKDYKSIIPIATFVGVFFFSEISFIPVYVYHLFSPSLFFIGLSLFSAMMRIFASSKIKNWNSKYIMIVSFFLYAVTFLLLVLLKVYPSASLLILAGILLGIGHGVIFPLTSALLDRKSVV